MNASDIIGFLISFAVFIYLMFRTAVKKEDLEEEEEESLPSLPVVKKKRPALKKETPLVSPHFDRLAKSDPYKVEKINKPSRAHLLIAGLKSKKDMVILNEIIGLPKGL